jgi:hypothetical protein
MARRLNYSAIAVPSPTSELAAAIPVLLRRVEVFLKRKCAKEHTTC